tara:strand:- start:961 stop:1194 length:234 start_codon:yes stop_codon:yes gene_type:complete
MKHYNDQGQLIVVGNFIRVRLPKTDARAKFINVDHIVSIDDLGTGHVWIQLSERQGGFQVLHTMEQILRMLSMAGEQ